MRRHRTELVHATALALLLGCGGAAAPTGPTMTDPVITSGHEVPPSTPYSQWEHHEHLGFLKSNGVAATREAWRAAAGAPDASIRAAACALLSEAPGPEDAAALRGASSDRDGAVRAWAALGLIRLGDRARLDELRGLAAGELTPMEPATLIAAGLLARLGEPAAEPVLTAAMQEGELRLSATRWLFDLARTNREAPWPLFAVALSDASAVVRALALAQLDELRDPRSRPALEELAAHGPGDESERARARQILSNLQP